LLLLPNKFRINPQIIITIPAKTPSRASSRTSPWTLNPTNTRLNKKETPKTMSPFFKIVFFGFIPLSLLFVIRPDPFPPVHPVDFHYTLPRHKTFLSNTTISFEVPVVVYATAFLLTHCTTFLAKAVITVALAVSLPIRTKALPRHWPALRVSVSLKQALYASPTSLAIRPPSLIYFTLSDFLLFSSFLSFRTPYFIPKIHITYITITPTDSPNFMAISVASSPAFPVTHAYIIPAILPNDNASRGSEASINNIKNMTIVIPVIFSDIIVCDKIGLILFTCFPSLSNPLCP